MKKLLYCVPLMLLISCQSKIEHVERAFYYWKSDLWDFSEVEKEVYDSLGIQKLYIKFFEVDYTDELGCHPISKTSLHGWRMRNFNAKTIVPTVYIKNEVFLRASLEDLDILADNLHFLVTKYKSKRFDESETTEYQMDCDWTPKTKEKYFYFLQKLKTLSGKQISCTLRLYPYKYPDKMGVPPVDKVMLMCYNLLNPLENPDKNSILDLSELKSYLHEAQAYPLHLDVALPIYAWAQVYHNEGFSATLRTDMQSLKQILQEEKPLWYKVNRDTVIENTFLRIGDRIKIEEIDADKLTSAIEILREGIRFDNKTTIALFHLDENQLHQFTHEELSGFYTDFSR